MGERRRVEILRNALDATLLIQTTGLVAAIIADREMFASVTA
jgi:hypothetical protein